MDMTIDLVSMTTGKASLKYYPDGYYQFYDANLERTFQSDGKDVAVTRITVITEGENGEETEYPKPTIEDNEKVGNGIHTTFDSFDKLLKKKAKGYTMRKIGFIG